MIVGIVVAKKHSKRFAGKNEYILNDEPMFWHSVKPLIDSEKVDDVYVATDSASIKKYCEEKGIGVIWRPRNASRDEDKLITILRYAYYSLEIEYDTLVTIMANCPGHSTAAVDRAISLMEKEDLLEVRSFNSKGEESGLLVFRKEILESNRDVSYYMGAVIEDVKEIHRLEDIND